MFLKYWSVKIGTLFIATNNPMKKISEIFRDMKPYEICTMFCEDVSDSTLFDDCIYRLTIIKVRDNRILPYLLEYRMCYKNIDIRKVIKKNYYNKVTAHKERITVSFEPEILEEFNKYFKGVTTPHKYKLDKKERRMIDEIIKRG